MVFCLVISVACGGSSGGSSSGSDSGDLSLKIEPSTLGIGNIGFVTLDYSDIQFDDLNAQGLTFKFVVPPALEFVSGSAALVLDDGASELQPLYSGRVGELAGFDSRSVILVFSVTGAMLRNQNSGTIQFSVRGAKLSTAAIVAVDLDRVAISNFESDARHFI